MISIKELFYRLVKSLRGARGLDFSLFVIQKTVISLFTGKIMHGRRHGWKLWLPEGAEVMCTPILGNGKLMATTVGRKGTIKKVSLPEKNDFYAISL